LDHKRKEAILELKDNPVEKKLTQYKQKLLHHIGRIEDCRYPK